MYVVTLPEVDLTVQLPLYKPCNGEPNSAIKYMVTAETETNSAGLPPWAVFDELARQV